MVQHWTDSFTDNVTESVQSWIYKPGISRRALLLPTVGFSAHPVMRADCAKEAHHSGRIHHEYFSSPTAKGNILDCFKKKVDRLRKKAFFGECEICLMKFIVLVKYVFFLSSYMKSIIAKMFLIYYLDNGLKDMI
ncbi:Ribonucleoside-diphosphate reductase subunit alpha [Dissostichus eleginoides]|uniref:Ribonucleoside-diphosphate reductase subunit alpha n=1 Tax=Dissostichus eleginoides TaxID=100907 RepID=A0AAD9FI22_DISEL|nr:Ribonucleoside-diphosphate reductase subunit alpha [Dissostichus eleginoides]